MTDQTTVRVDEVVFTDTGTGAVPGPAREVTVSNEHEEEGPTGVVPPPPASVTTYDFPYDSEGNLLPTAKPSTKQVTADDVEDKSVKSKSTAKK